VERAVLLMAALELTSTRKPVSGHHQRSHRNHQTFGGTDGHKFVNGVLDKLAADVRADEVASQRSRRQG
jgi:N utilization substance protein B